MDKRSVFSGPLEFGRLNIDVSIYKSTDDFCLPGSLYHEGCNGKVRERRFCEDHPDDEDVAVFSGMDILNNIVPIDSELRDALLERSAPFKVVSSHKLTELPWLMANSDLVVQGRYMVQHLHLPSRSIDLPSRKVGLATLLSRLAVKRQFLLCTIGLAGCKRYAILLPNAQLLTLHYSDELRDFDLPDGAISREVAQYIDDQLVKLSKDFPKLSLKNINKKVEAWFNKHLTIAVKPRTNKKKTERTKVNV